MCCKPYMSAVLGGGHSGIQGTYHHVKSLFARPKLKQAVTTYVQSCQICQQAKTEHVKLPGLLQPLSIPTCVWDMISLDFIEGLPWSQNHNAILVVIDKFSKYAHFLPMTHTLLRCTDCTGYHEPSS
jgi:hypothetical protein